jgi:hypothetical protein
MRLETKVVITLERDDLLALQAILVDDDRDAALDFIKTNLCPKIPGKGSAPCDSTRLNPYLFKRK